MGERPAWASRIRRERELRGWSQAAAVTSLCAHEGEQESVLRHWKSWETGAHHPSEVYQRLIATTFGMPWRALFPKASQERATTDDALISATGMDTLEVLSRLRASDVDATTLEGLSVIVDRLCSRYPHVPAEILVRDARLWLSRVTDLRNRRLTLAQHREVLSLAGWLALLVGCLDYDADDRHAAETSRQTALSLGREAEHDEIQGWAEEMRAWFALTTGDYRGVVTAARSGIAIVSGKGVTVQLVAQEAKAWAHLGDRRQVELALDKSRHLLDLLPYPDNIANHFVIDPSKFDFYAMECYRTLGENDLAEHLAEQVLSAGIEPSGREDAPMRISEARTTLGIVAARRGELEQAVHFGLRALVGERKSIPHLLMSARQLGHILCDRYSDESLAHDYIEEARQLARRNG